MKTSITKQSAFEAAVQQYGPLIARLCRYYSRCSEESRDLQQDTLLNLWRGWDSFSGAANRQTWIYRVCLNTCVSAMRRYKHQPERAPEEVLRSLPDDADASETREQVHELLMRLSPADRAMMLLWLESRPYDEIADIMGLPRNTVATRLRRAKERMKAFAEQTF